MTIEKRSYTPDRQHRARKKVVIVDDSKALRGWLRVVLEKDHRLIVVGEAQDSVEARHIIKQTVPDVVTLDIEMPGMNGLDFLEKLMTLRPTPVVMISGGTEHNSIATVKALSLGAVDCILKPTTIADEAAIKDISRRVFAAACSNVQPLRPTLPRRASTAARIHHQKMPIILIGASTGGVSAIETVLLDLNPNGPPVVIVQHMPEPFLVSFSQQLNRKLPQSVQLARENEPLGPGMVRIAPALGQHTGISRKTAEWSCHFLDDTPKAPYCPSVDHLFASACENASDVIAVILTGLGRDGAAALLDLKRAGSRTFGQDGSSCVVYGMPRAAWDLGAVEKQLDIKHIGAAINAVVAEYGLFHKDFIQ